MHWYIDVLKKYATFSGRARRQEYWMFTLINSLIYVALAAIGIGVLNTVAIAAVYELATLIPSLAVSVRRLHDTGRSGAWLFFAFVPLVGAITLLVFLATDSKPEPSEYGPNPKLAAAAV
ncbi:MULTISPECIES: DUF805 domain-containing protein [unclassified Streptomyces]|uniref:DUF805 domain-containing protein n=1 Tax=unclassified Streptomyces TaxID=2593676 RepID=UPI0030CAA5A0